jgi:protein-S-isoprenylcysteine O-methyltransferase Ste14
MKCADVTPVQWFLGLFTPMVFLRLLLPWHATEHLPPLIVSVIGIKLLLLAAILNTFALLAFKKHRTGYDPGDEPETLIQEGIFALSRNPVYLALVLAMLGTGCILDTLWALPSALLLFTALNRCTVAGEESKLEKRFGSAYDEYRRKTRRWF